jgi:class 3 adenylate cyclase
VFADLIGSTSLHERLDAESARRVMDGYYRALRAAVEAHGGTVVKLLGDGVMAAFGIPRVAEDDALRAVRAGLAMQHAFRTLVEAQPDTFGGLGLRVAVNTGEVVVSHDNTDVVGDPVNVAARLQQEAHDGDVLLGDSTRRLVADLVTPEPFGARALKGRTETVAAYRVVSLDRPAAAPAAAFVGRDDELRRLRAAYDAALTRRRARLVVVLGSPGVGKSRLLDEFARRLGALATVLAARCDSAGGATFAPLAAALRAHLGVDARTGAERVRAVVAASVPADEPEHTRIADGVAALLAGAPAPPEETFFVVRRLLGALAASRPVVLAIDDLQWAEPLLLELVEHLAQWTTGGPLLVLAGARPELRDTRPAFAAAGGVVNDVVALAGLDAGAATRLAASVIGADELPAAVAGRVLAASEGNPLFVRELVRMLVHDGALRREGDRWTAGAELARVDMPPTIHAVLAARIEALHPAERSVLERAAVIGRQFSRAAVAHLLSADANLDARLDALQRGELIEPDVGSLLGEPVLRFHHALVRDAAYRRLLKGTRAELHERFAAWLAERAGPAVEHDETIGWHLEQAHRHRRELGALDAHGVAVGARAARHLAAAGRRALARDDLPPAGNLLGRALALLEPADPARGELALDWCETLLAAGDVGPATRALDELGRFADGSVRLRAWHTCFVGERAALTDPQALRATVDAVATAAGALAAAGDAAGEAKAHFVHALALGRLGQVGASEATLDRALAAARRAGDRRRANAVLAGAPLAALWGPSPVTRASGRCLDVVRVLRIAQGAPAVEAVALRCQAVLEAMRGRTDAARGMIASSRRMLEELGITQRLLETDVFAGLIELIEGDAVAAERALRAAYDGLRRYGLGIDAAQAAALLGRALLLQGRAAEAETLSHESEALAGDDLKAAIAWRGVRAEALARRGEHGAAIALARAAVDIAAATDALLDHADARRALAVALRAAGRADEADVEDARTLELWEAKGAVLLAARARGGGHRPEAREEEAAVQDARFANAVCRAQVALEHHWEARDWDAVVASFPPTFRMEDRRPLVGVDIEGSTFFANLRLLYETPSSHWHTAMVATRGERLALFRVRFSGEIDPGMHFTDEHLSLIEIDAAGRRAGMVVFGVADRAAAWAELDERYAAGEGAPHQELLANLRGFRDASAARDWARLAHLLPADFSLLSHRRLVGTSSRLDREAYVAAHGFLEDLAVRGDLRLDHVSAVSANAALIVVTWYGTAAGGEFEDPFVVVLTHDGRRIHALELFDLDQLDAARQRYDELEVEKDGSSASRAATRIVDACLAGDRERVRALVPVGFAYVDRRGDGGVVRGRDELLAAPAVVATRGDRLALVRVGTALALVEVDDRGDPARLVTFAAADVEAASAELEARFAADAAAERRRGTVTRAFTAAFVARDWDALATLLAADVEVNDHRLIGWETLRGRAPYVEALRSLVELAPDVRLRIDNIRMADRRFLYVTTWLGTREGGAFEAPSVIICELDEGGLIRRIDQYDLDHLDEARADLASPPGI